MAAHRLEAYATLTLQSVERCFQITCREVLRGNGRATATREAHGFSVMFAQGREQRASATVVSDNCGSLPGDRF